jgi:hypothetical protein
MQSPPTVHVAARIWNVTPLALTPANDNEPPDPPPALALRAPAPRLLTAFLPAGAAAIEARLAV